MSLLLFYVIGKGLAIFFILSSQCLQFIIQGKKRCATIVTYLVVISSMSMKGGNIGRLRLLKLREKPIKNKTKKQCPNFLFGTLKVYFVMPEVLLAFGVCKFSFQFLLKRHFSKAPNLHVLRVLLMFENLCKNNVFKTR